METRGSFRLRHTASFRGLLRTLDDATARKIAQKYIQFLYEALDYGLPKTDKGVANITGARGVLATALFGAAVDRGVV